jgi:hypothetical protein
LTSRRARFERAGRSPNSDKSVSHLAKIAAQDAAGSVLHKQSRPRHQRLARGCEQHISMNSLLLSAGHLSSHRRTPMSLSVAAQRLALRPTLIPGPTIWTQLAPHTHTRTLALQAFSVVRTANMQRSGSHAAADVRRMRRSLCFDQTDRTDAPANRRAGAFCGGRLRLRLSFLGASGCGFVRCEMWDVGCGMWDWTANT